MTSRERVRMALAHQEPDLVPIDFCGSRLTGISAIAYNNLKKHLGIKGGHTKVFDLFQQLAMPEEEVLRAIGTDVIELRRLRPSFGIDIRRWKKDRLPDGSDCLVPYNFDPTEDERGYLRIVKDGKVIACMPPGGLYFDLMYHPFAGANSEAEIDRVSMPEITDEELDFLGKQAKELHERTDYVILGSFGGKLIEDGQNDWGYEEFYLNLALNPGFMRYYLEKKTQTHLRNLQKYLAAVGKYIDVIQFSDDIGTQEGLQISVKMYCDLIKPFHSRIYQYVRNNYPRIKVFLHSCGAIFDVIPDLIEAGVQVLNPVQLSAKSMDPIRLKREFGRDITFWGAGCNLQTTATFGSVDDIKKEVAELIGIFAPGGGFVFSHIHNIQADIAPEKIVAIYETARALRKYS